MDRRKRFSTGRALASAVACVAGLVASSAQADVENLLFQNFDTIPVVTGAPNDGAALSAGEPFFYSYSGNDPGAVGGGNVLIRRVGITDAGVGGTNAAFIDMDASAVKNSTGGNTWWYAGMGRYVYNDPFIGGAYDALSQVTWTVDARGEGLSPVPQDAVTMRFEVQRGGGLPAAWAGQAQGYFDDTFNVIGGGLDTFTSVGSENNFTGAHSFIAQLQPNTGAFGGNDAGNRMVIDNFRIAITRSNWKGTNGNSLDDASNWSESTVPTGNTAFPIFRTANGTPQSLTLNSALVVNRIDFESADAYTITGEGSITIRGTSPGALVETSTDRTHTINVPVTVDKATAGIRVNAGGSNLVLAGGLTSTGSLSKDRNGRLSAKFIRTAGALNILGGSVTLLADQTTTSKVASLTFAAALDGTDHLELNDSRMIVDYTGASPLAALQTALANNKIRSALATEGSAIVVAERSDFTTLTAFGDLTPDATSILIVATLKGDSDLNQTVNFDDLLALSQNYGLNNGATWAKGDSNGDAAVNFDDLLALSQNYGGSLSLAASQLGGSGGAAFAADLALAQSLVPEPASLTAIALAAAGLAGRRRRRLD